MRMFRKLWRGRKRAQNSLEDCLDPSRIGIASFTALTLISLCVIFITARYTTSIYEWDTGNEVGTTLFHANGQPPPCKNFTVPAVIFSLGGFNGHLLYDFNEALIPLFTTVRQFSGEVQLLVTDIKPWWIKKYNPILRQLSNYEVIGVDYNKDQDTIDCAWQILTPINAQELKINPSTTPNGYTMVDFKKMLRKAFGLPRTAAMTEVVEGDRGKISTRTRTKPRLLIISRKKSRKFTNVSEVVSMAKSLGFEVTVGEADKNTNLSEFARMVNSNDVLLAVHGAGLTNMVFLPESAVVIQIVPFGIMESSLKSKYTEPSQDMKLHYFEYLIGEDETTLKDKYPKDHPVMRDPKFVDRKLGWGSVSRIYLEEQNVTPNLWRLRETLIEAMTICLRRSEN